MASASVRKRVSLSRRASAARRRSASRSRASAAVPVGRVRVLQARGPVDEDHDAARRQAAGVEHRIGGIFRQERRPVAPPQHLVVEAHRPSARRGVKQADRPPWETACRPAGYGGSPRACCGREGPRPCRSRASAAPCGSRRCSFRPGRCRKRRHAAPRRKSTVCPARIQGSRENSRGRRTARGLTHRVEPFPLSCPFFPASATTRQSRPGSSPKSHPGSPGQHAGWAAAAVSV